MTLQDAIKAVITNEHGWAVAEQFEVTWDNRSVESVEQQNSNAMNYIVGTINGLIKYNDIFSEEAIDELQSYLDDIKEAYDEINANDEGPEYDSAGFTDDDRIVNGQYRGESHHVSNDEADEDYRASLNQDEQRYENKH